MLNTPVQNPSTTRQISRKCPYVQGKVQVCDYTYGNNGWLGVASIYISGSHITQGVVKMNDTYFNTSKYTTSAWRNLVMCQEVGHTLGLDHQDETFDNGNLNTCMDYTNSPDSNQHPNTHDYYQLTTIYQHPDSSNTEARPFSSLQISLPHWRGVSPGSLLVSAVWARVVELSGCW